METRPIPENGPRLYSPPRRYSPVRSRLDYDEYTPLVASIEHIYEVNKKGGFFKKPAPLSASQSRDKKKYCAYHESHGHDTHECRQLKEEIEKLIREGKLT